MRKPGRLRCCAAALLVATWSVAAFAQTPPMAAGPALDAKVDALLAQMTLEEKVLQLLVYTPNGLPRMGIPSLRSGEVLHGVVSSGATVFPQAIALGSTWDPMLMQQVGTVVAAEARAVGLQQGFAPMLGLARDPRWGRVEESYGEDPYLTARIGVAYVEGLQGMGAQRFGPERIFATPKHFVADGEPWAGANGEAYEISERVLRDVYMRPFEAVVREAHPESLMPAHHPINGVPSHANPWLLKTVLRDEWGFDGFTTSDMGDIPKLFGGHGFASSPEDAGVKAIEAGVDTELSSGHAANYTYLHWLPLAVREGKLPVSVVDDAARRVLRAKLMLLGLSAPVSAPAKEPTAQDQTAAAVAAYKGTDDVWAKLVEEGKFTTSAAERSPNAAAVLNDATHDALALRAEQEAIVLLKNDGNLLPLSPAKMRHVLIAGPLGKTASFGGYSAGRAKLSVDPVQGIRALLGSSAQVDFVAGGSVTASTDAEIAAAVKASQDADVVIAVVGHTRAQLGENRDRDTLELSGRQEQLVEALAATGKPLVVVLQNGAPFGIEWIHDHVSAVVESWYGGQAYGQALAQVLFGEVNPSGHLDISFPRNVGQIPAYYNHLPLTGPIDYFGNAGQDKSGPLWAFGRGLSFTSFVYSGLLIDAGTLHAGHASAKEPMVAGGGIVSLKVKNNGQRAGVEVVQLYLHQRFTSLEQPVQRLEGFARVALEAGEEKTISLPVSFDAVKFWKDSGWVAEAGDVEVQVGAASDDIRLRGVLTLPGR